MNNNFIDEIRENGIVKIKNFLSPDELTKLSNIVRFYKVPKGDKKSIFITSFKVLLIKLLKLDIKRILDTYELMKLSKNKNLDKIAKEFFNKQVKLAQIDGYYSKVSNKEILPWHTDKAYAEKKISEEKFIHPEDISLKFFIYLTNVSPNNGCMSYIPKSHKIGYAIRSAIYNKEIPYHPYYHIKDFAEIIKINKNFFINKLGSEMIENFLVETKIENSINTTNKFDYTAEAGSMIIFNEGGVHRGSKPSLNDRMVIRYFFSII